MPRYLEFPVGGDKDYVAERAHQAFRRIGRVKTFDPETGVAGVIHIDSIPATLQVTWTRRENERWLMEMEAESDDRLSEAADRALYRFARTYKHLEEEGGFNWRPLVALVLLALVVAGLFLLRR